VEVHSAYPVCNRTATCAHPIAIDLYRSDGGAAFGYDPCSSGEADRLLF